MSLDPLHDPEAPTVKIPVPIAGGDVGDDAPTVRVTAPLPNKGALGFPGFSVTGLSALFANKAEPAKLEPGCEIGCYRLIRRIADGGFGTVWLAEQQEPVVREVALKLIRPDKASPEIISRFERERQALAMMDHENIATVYDAGEHEGQLYFAMEYVPGEPITEYVRNNNLSLRQRLQLFIPVCRAVHHAHTKFILHRDLKPSNILVKVQDGKATPKVIDFGIAKALTDDHAILRADTGALPVTQVGYVMGTPQYMSPEQARGDTEIYASSDTYTLGVILYELLVGEPPVTSEELQKLKGHYDILEYIIKHEPSLPSTLWFHASTRKTHAFDTTLGKNPRSISRQMRGDLDCIILHALERDHTHRYDSADKLADDLQRHLENEPVSVGPPSLSYRLYKLYLRHKVVTTAAVVVLLSIAVGGGLAFWQWREALAAQVLEASARHRAEAAQAAESQARKQAETSEALAKTREQDAVKARELEAKAHALAEDQRHKAEAAREQEARARHASDIARAEAEDLINFMLYDLRDRLEPLNRTPLLSTVAEKAEAYFAAQSSTLGDNSSQSRNRAAMHQNKGLIELAQGKYDAALASFASFLAIINERAKQAPQSEENQSDLALAHNRLGMAYQGKGDLMAATQEYLLEQKAVLTLLKSKPDSTAWRQHLATTYEHLGDVSDAPLADYQPALAMLEKLHAEVPKSEAILRSLATAHEKLGLALRALEKPEQALPHYDQQVALLQSLPADKAGDVRIRRAQALALQHKGDALLMLHRNEDALAALDTAVSTSQAIAESDPGNTLHQADLANAQELLATCHGELGRSLIAQGKPATIKAGLEHLIQGRDALRASVALSKGDASRLGKLKTLEETILEVSKLLR